MALPQEHAEMLKMLLDVKHSVMQVVNNDLGKVADELESKPFELIRPSRELTKEEEKNLKIKAPLYRVIEHTDEELYKMMVRVTLEAQAIGGLPRHHSEALTKRGWLLPFLLAYDQLFWGRWDYWLDILAKGTIEGSGPIPQIEWCDDSNTINQVRKMLFKCMDEVHYEGVNVSHFADWLLWGMGQAEEPPKVSAKVNEHWYRTFDLALVLKHPTDYLSNLLEELAGRGYQDALGYFATPMQVTRMMAEMVYSDLGKELSKEKSVSDCCCGCGAMLLPASNYCLFGYGQDISMMAVKLCRVQMMWFAPWFAKNPFTKKD